MVKAKKTKFLYLVFALALFASLVPLTALPAVAANGPRLELYPSGSSKFDVIGHVQRVKPVGLGGLTVSGWTIGDVVADTDAQIVSSATGAEGTAYADIVAFTWGEATIMATLSNGSRISAVKKWGQIDWTEISPPNESPVYWKEENKTWTGEGWADDYVVGTFKDKDGNIYHEYAQGAELHWFLINIRAERQIPRGPGDPDALIATISGLARATFVEFAHPRLDPTHTMTVTNQYGWGGVNFTTWGEEAVVIVVVPDYPVENNLTVVPEITKWNFWTYEMEKVPQVRWAGEKIVLEKYFGPWAAGWPVSFRLENQSVGTLEGAGPIPDFFGFPLGFNLSNTNDTVWTVVDEFGWAEAILTSEAPGEADVTLALYNPFDWRKGWYWIENQHGFVVYFLKLEEITLSNVVGNRANHNDGRWIPENPWDASTDVLSETLNVSEDTLLRARVKGWFMGDNLSGRDAKYVDFDPQWDTNGDGDPTNDRDLTLPAGRWVLPNDWPILAGPDWVELRKHWDIMDQPDDSIMSVHGNEWGNYLTSNGHGSRVAEWPVIGPFTPGWELPTPYGWDDALIFLQKTVVPNGRLNWWDAPMPPAKITFKIKSGPGFFKEADKGLIYYHDDGGIHYTNPFYAVMIPAHWKIPAFINNGGYDWDSWNPYYGPYDFWTIVNRPPNPQQPSDDSANYPTKVQVYSDNHGEAMVFLNGDYNLDLSRWITNGAYDVPFGAEVGTTEAEAMADYPYLRKHQAFVSNHVEKTWTWGKQILGADPADYPGGSVDPSNTRMVFQVGTINPVTGLSDKKMAFIWVKDRDGFPAVGERIEWRIGLGTNAEIPPITGVGVSIYLPNIAVTNGFLANTKGRVLNADRTRGESYTRTATSAERALFNKFWGSAAWGKGYAVAAIEILTSDPEVIDLTIYLNEREGTIIRHTNLDFSVPDALDDPLLRGDANRSGVVDMGDYISVERMILGLDPTTANADVNGDGVINMGDAILIESMILGQ